MKNKILMLGIFLTTFMNISLGQSTTSTNNYANGRYIGYSSNNPLTIKTNALDRAIFTTGNSLGPGLVTGVGPGDGLSILPKTSGCNIPGTAALDLWTSCANGTNIRWDGSGQISGINNRFEQWANLDGFWFNTITGTGRYIFNRTSIENARVGINDFWRIGLNPSNFDANRRLEVFESSNRPQFRISHSSDNVVTQGSFTDFYTRSTGNLNILPSNNTGVSGDGRVLINLDANPTHTLDINGNERIRVVAVDPNPDALFVGNRMIPGGANDFEVRRKDFPMNPNVFLNGNGQFTNVGGLDCWDLDGDGIQDAAEDINNDNAWNSLDCQGATGATGATGPAGTNGTNGTNGANGTNGIDGQDGEDGQDGATGPTGPAGADGLTIGAHNGTSMSTFDNTRIAFGQNLGETFNPGQLLNHREIPMNQQQIRFNDGFVNVNSQAGEYNIAGLSVRPGSTGPSFHPFYPSYESFYANRALNVINTNQNPIGIESYANDVTGSNLAIGIIGSATSITPLNGSVIGVDAYGDGKQLSGLGIGAVIGLRATSGNSTGESYGVRAFAEGNSVRSIAVQGWSRGATANDAFGVFGQVSGTSTNACGVYGTASGGSNSNWAGFFEGNVNVTGNVYAASVYGPNLLTSDQNLKTNITSITNATETLNKINTVKFYYDTLNTHGIRLKSGIQYGVIAQQADTVIPNVTETITIPARYDSLGNIIAPEYTYKVLNYNAFTPYLIKASQEQNVLILEKDSLISDLTVQNQAQQATIDSQQGEIDDLKTRMARIEACMLANGMCEVSQSLIQQTPQELQNQLTSKTQVTLSNKNSIVLFQNVPNPYSESTVIEYNIPVSVQKAQIQFFDGLGQLINAVDIVERGRGELTVFANDLSSGIYTYTLVADGAKVATKKMMKN